MGEKLTRFTGSFHVVFQRASRVPFGRGRESASLTSQKNNEKETKLSVNCAATGSVALTPFSLFEPEVAAQKTFGECEVSPQNYIGRGTAEFPVPRSDQYRPAESGKHSARAPGLVLRSVTRVGVSSNIFFF